MVDPTTEAVQMENHRVGSPFLGKPPSLNVPLPGESPFYKAWIAGLESGGPGNCFTQQIWSWLVCMNLQRQGEGALCGKKQQMRQ